MPFPPEPTLDDFAHLSADNRREAGTDALREGLVRACAKMREYEDLGGDFHRDAFRALAWRLVDELALRGEEGHERLLGLLEAPDATTCMAVARATFVFAREKTFERLRELAASSAARHAEEAEVALRLLEEGRGPDDGPFGWEPYDQGSYLDFLGRVDAESLNERCKRALEAFVTDGRPLQARLDDLAVATGLGRIKAHIQRFVLPAIAIQVGDALAAAAPGETRIGGQPDLPAGFAWPLVDGRPASFLMQVNLHEVAAAGGLPDFPASGVLSFFYDAVEQPWDDGAPGSWGVHHFPDAARLAPTACPSATPHKAFPARRARLQRIFTICRNSTVICEAVGGGQSFEAAELADEIDEILTELEGLSLTAQLESWKRPFAQLGGFGRYIQGEDPNSYNGLDAQTDAAARRLLLQLGSDPRTGMMWGDSGQLYYQLTLGDLRGQAFSAVRGHLECH